MTVVVDASVAAQWVLDQEGSERAATLRAEDGLIAPSLIAAEVGSAIWKAVRRGIVKRADALIAAEIALAPFESLVPTEELRIRALVFAIELEHPIYDCFYIALAERERCALITADRKLIVAARQLQGVELRLL